MEVPLGVSVGDGPGELPDARSYIFPRQRIAFISVAKNACTSIKWMLARLSGQDEQRFLSHPVMKVDPAFTIHRRHLWQSVPKLSELTTDELSDIHPDNGWFVFGVTRDPRTRLFSAWQSKFLLRLPTYVKAADEPFFPRVPTSTRDVLEDFATFVRYLREDPTHPMVHPNVHFRSQSDLLQTAHIPYSRVYDVRELGELPRDLGEHLRTHGLDDEPVLGNEHGAPLRPYQAVFAGGVRELVEEHYASDFAAFGDRWDFATIPAEPPSWPSEVFRAIGTTLAAYEQIRRISLDCRAQNAEVRRLRRRLGDDDGSD